MSQWEREFEDIDIDIEDYDNYFKDNDMTNFFEIPIYLVPEFELDKQPQTQENISDSTSKGPPDMPRVQKSPDKLSSDFYRNPNIEYNKPELNFETKMPLRSNNPKHMASLNSNENSFRESFYSIFLNNIKGKKIIPKDKVIEIHNTIFKEAGVRKMKRNEYRTINNYFKNFAPYKEQILRCIVQNKAKLSALIDLPSIIQRANENVEARKRSFH